MRNGEVHAHLISMKSFISLLLLLAVHPAWAADRPNILFAFADDWGRHASIYAEVDGPGSVNDVLHTPHFDRVAKEGALFKNAFVNAPSCTPCRSSLLSGQHFYRTGRAAILQGAIWDGSVPAYPLILNDAGYHIGKTYKVWTPGSPADAPYGGNKYAYQQGGSSYNRFSQIVTELVGKGESVDAAKSKILKQVEDNLEHFLKARKGDTPFCYWFGPTLVHRKWTKGSGKKLWGIDPDDLKGKMPTFLPDVHEVREDLADYFGEIQAFDAALGIMLKRLEKIGELDNTLIVVSGDHGAPGFPRGKCNLYDFGVAVPLAVRWGAGNGGRVLDDFVSLPDLAPTFLEAAGAEVPKVMTGRSLVDVIKSKQKKGLVDKARTWVIAGRERHVAAARAGNLPYPQRSIRTQDHLYIINFEPSRWPMGDPTGIDENKHSRETLTENTFAAFGDLDASPTKAWMIENRKNPKYSHQYDLGFGRRPAEELFVIADDPDQVNNVADDPKYRAIRNELRARLLKELKDTADPRVTGDGKTFERSPFSDRWSRGKKRK